MNRIYVVMIALVSSCTLLSCSDPRTDSSQAAVGWQTYCSVPIDFTTTRGREFSVQKVGRPSSDIRSGHLIVSHGELRAQDVTNFQQFKLVNGQFEKVEARACPPFQAYGW